jgi:outer membrane protein
MMPYRFLLFLAMLIGAMPLSAQNPLTLEQALTLAVQRDWGLKNARLNTALSENELEKVQAQRAPVVSGSGDLRYNPILQTVVIPGEAFGQPGDEAEKVRFGTNFSLLLGVDASYKLIDPTYVTRTQLELMRASGNKLTERVVEQDLKLEVTSAYYELALQTAQEALAAQRLARAGDLLAVMKTRAEAGAALPVDVQKSELDMLNAESLRVQSRNQKNRSSLQLASLLGIQAEDILLPDNILNVNSKELELPVVNASEVNERSELLEINQRINISALELKLADQSYRPSLDAYANASMQHLSDDLALWQRWFPFAFVGLRANLPIYDGKIRQRNKEGIGLQMQIHQNDLARLREELTLEMQNALIDQNNAAVSLRYSESALMTARDILKTDEKRFREGSLLFSEWRNSEFALREAEAAYLTAAHQWLTAQLRRLRAGGKL